MRGLWRIQLGVLPPTLPWKFSPGEICFAFLLFHLLKTYVTIKMSQPPFLVLSVLFWTQSSKQSCEVGIRISPISQMRKLRLGYFSSLLQFAFFTHHMSTELIWSPTNREKHLLPSKNSTRTDLNSGPLNTSWGKFILRVWDHKCFENQSLSWGVKMKVSWHHLSVIFFRTSREGGTTIRYTCVFITSHFNTGLWEHTRKYPHEEMKFSISC